MSAELFGELARENIATSNIIILWRMRSGSQEVQNNARPLEEKAAVLLCNMNGKIGKRCFS
jgi:hypothetical protein